MKKNYLHLRIKNEKGEITEGKLLNSDNLPKYILDLCENYINESGGLTYSLTILK